MRRNGFSLIEVLVVVLIIGILTALVMGNYFNAVHRAKQKKTMADIRSIAVAWEARAVDVRQYNAAGATTMPDDAMTHAQLSGMLSPTYMRNIAQYDGWNHAIEFRVDAPFGGATPAAAYAIRSPGRDGKYSGTTYDGGPTTEFDCDIVYLGGQFVVWPEGTQQK
jgi:general secretion pathway protein G